MRNESVNSGRLLRKARRLRLRKEPRIITTYRGEHLRDEREPWYSPVLAVIAAVLIWAILYTVIHLVSERRNVGQFFSPLGELIDQVAHLAPIDHVTM